VTDRLSLYNGALGILGERALASLSENREPRRLLDAVWDAGAVDYALEMGQWKFALRAVELAPTPSIEPDFGFRYAFTKPDDFVRTAAVCEDEYFITPLLRYSDEAGYWFADRDPIYVKYVSDDDRYGYDFSRWPGTFVRWFESYLALRICKRLTQAATDYESLKRDTGKLLVDARSKDALADPTAFPPQGHWGRARHGNTVWGRARERGGW
jgi:hypothetical protein